MSNMSYCRFRNTLSDLQDCKQALNDMVIGNGDKLSRDELEAAKELLRSSRELLLSAVDDFGINFETTIDDDGFLEQVYCGLEDLNANTEERW